MEHKDKIEFLAKELSISPIMVAGLLGVTFNSLISGDSLKANLRIDRLYSYVTEATRVGIPKSYLYGLLHEKLDEGIETEEDSEFSLSSAVCMPEISEGMYRIILNLSLKVMLDKIKVGAID